MVISRKEKRKLLKRIQVLVNNLEKIFARRVLIFTAFRSSSAGLLNHFSTSREFLLAQRASCFKPRPPS
jgi:ERCC4-related helicase